MFLALGAIFFTQFAGLSPREFGGALTIAGAAGILAGYSFGRVADQLEPRRLTAIGVALEAVSLLAVPWATNQWVFAILVALATFGSRGAVSARNTFVANAFTRAEGNRIRAQVRVLINLGVGLATIAAAGVLTTADPDLLQLALTLASTTTLMSAVLAARLPAVATPVAQEAATVQRPHRGPWRNPRFVTLTAANVIAGTQISLLQVGLPLWTIENTAAPPIVVSLQLLTNTIVIVGLQVPLTRGLEEMSRAGLAYLGAGGLLLLACTCYYTAGLGGPGLASMLLLTGVLAHTVAEIWAVGAAQSAAVELATPGNSGAYQGTYVAAQSASSMVGPIAVTFAVTLDIAGWSVLAVALTGGCTTAWILLRDPRAATALKSPS